MLACLRNTCEKKYSGRNAVRKFLKYSSCEGALNLFLNPWYSGMMNVHTVNN